MGGVLGSIVRLAVLAGVGAWLIDRWLRDRAGGTEPAPIRTSIEIDSPIERVWAVLADVERQPEWMHDLREVRLLTPPPVGVGTRAVGRVQAFGIAVEDPIEVTVFEPPLRYAIRHEGIVRGSGDIRLVPDDGDGDGATTLLTWEEVLVPRLLPHLGGLVVALVFRPIFERDLERLAALVEAEA